MKGADGCKRIPSDSKDEEQDDYGSTKRIMKSMSELLAHEAVLYRDFVTVLRRRMTMSSSQDAVLTSQDESEDTRQSVAMLNGMKT